MSKFSNAVNDLIAIASSPEAEPTEIKAAATLVCNAVARPSRVELDEELKRLADTIATADLPGAAIIAICCGAIVEKGGNPDISLEATLSRLSETLTLAQFFAEACEEAAADDEDKDDKTDDSDDEEDPVQRFGEQVAEKMPENSNAYHSIEALGMGAIAMLSRSPSARKNVRKEHPELAALAGDLAPYHERAYFLQRILSVLDDERAVVLHPDQKKGYRIRMSGVGTNFELFILLADAVIGDTAQGWLGGQKPDADVVAACRDQPAEAAKGKSTVGAFNFYNWKALYPDGTLPAPGDYSSSKDWIWMEGIPADITTFEGQRVILLGPPPYARVLQPGRCFDGMVADVHVDSQMSAEEVEEWLAKLRNAPR